MSEVLRYKAIKLKTEAGNIITYTPHGPDFVPAEAYDQLRAELAALKAGEGEAVEVVAWRSERYICGESHYSPPRLTFEQPYSTDRNCEPLMTVAQHERIVAEITASPASADTVSVAPGLERAIQIVREVAKTQPGYSDEREAIFEALSEAYVEAKAPQPPPASVNAVSVPRELLELEWLEGWLRFAAEPIGQECCGRGGQECCGCPDPVYPCLEDVGRAMDERAKELRALLAQSESKEVKP